MIYAEGWNRNEFRSRLTDRSDRIQRSYKRQKGRKRRRLVWRYEDEEAGVFLWEYLVYNYRKVAVVNGDILCDFNL